MAIRICVLLSLCLLATAVRAEERVALVIANGTYAGARRPGTTAADATLVANALRETGFRVQVEQDAGREGLVATLRRFETEARTADWALVYYAGLGLEVGGVAYLVPVDARLLREADVAAQAVSLPTVQTHIEGARKLRLVIFDGGRDNPFFSGLKRLPAVRPIGRGLADRTPQRSGSIVAYAVAAGRALPEAGAGQANGPYAAALVRHLATRDIEVSQLFRRVRADVLQATGRGQEPVTYEDLPDERFVVRP